MQDNAKESCMISFRLLHSHLKAFSDNDLKGTCIEGGFERAFATLFDQDFQSFTGSMFLNLDQLGKQLDKEEFQEIGSFDAFRVLMTQFWTFINFQYYFDNDEGLMIRKYFIAYTKTNVPLFHATLIQHIESLKELILERPKHKREKDRRVNDRMMQSKERKDNSSNALDADLVVTKRNETESEMYVLSSRSRNDMHTDDEDFNSVNDKQPMAEVDRNTTPESTDISHRGGEIDQNVDAKKWNEKLNKENKHLKQIYKDLFDSIKKKSVQTKDHADSLIVQLNCNSVENADLKAQIQKKVFANVALKNELRKSKGNIVDTKFAKPSILGKSVLQPPENQSVVRQPNAFKSKRPNLSKPRFASQVDVNNVLSKPVTPHYLLKVRESAPAKPNHVNAPRSSRNSKKESYGSNDMAYNYYLEEAKKKTQEKDRNFKPREMPFAKTHHTHNACTPKPRSNNQTSKNWPASKSYGSYSNIWKLSGLVSPSPMESPCKPRPNQPLTKYKYPLHTKCYYSLTKWDQQPLPNCPPLDASLGTERGLKPPIKPQSPDSFRIKVLDNLTIHTPPSSLVASFHLRDLYCYYRLCIDDPKKHYGFEPGLLEHSGSLGVDFLKLEMIDNDWGLESKEVYFLGRGLNSPI
nr:hypothetical protein [Tanacetum cinerariifolium]